MTSPLINHTAVVLTVSDSCFAGTRQDASGPAVAAVLASHGFQIAAQLTVPDEIAAIVAAVHQHAERAALIVTTGGTGIAARDVTPEATRQVCDRILDGFGELMRREGLKQTLLAPLSRALCGVCTAAPDAETRSTLVLNLPGSPAGAVASLEAVIGLIPHALALLAGDTSH